MFVSFIIYFLVFFPFFVFILWALFYGRHSRAETRFRPILPVVVDASKSWSSACGFQHLPNHSTETRLLVGTIVAVEHPDLHGLINLAESSVESALDSGF